LFLKHDFFNQWLAAAYDLYQLDVTLSQTVKLRAGPTYPSIRPSLRKSAQLAQVSGIQACALSRAAVQRQCIHSESGIRTSADIPGSSLWPAMSSLSSNNCTANRASSGKRGDIGSPGRVLALPSRETSIRCTVPSRGASPIALMRTFARSPCAICERSSSEIQARIQI